MNAETNYNPSFLNFYGTAKLKHTLLFASLFICSSSLMAVESAITVTKVTTALYAKDVTVKSRNTFLMITTYCAFNQIKAGLVLFYSQKV